MALAVFRRPMSRDADQSGPGQSLAVALRSRDSERLRKYRELLDFYQGLHFSSTRRGRTRLVVNYARAVVDKGVSYLFGRGLQISAPEIPRPLRGATGGEGQGNERAREAEDLLRQIAEENELDFVLIQAATNASVFGDAVLKVFWDVVARRVRVVNVDPFRFFPAWASDDPGTLREVVLTGRLSAAEARERYGAPGSGFRAPNQSRQHETRNTALETLEVWTPTEFRLFVGEVAVHEGPNPYGFIPFVHMANLQPPNSPWGVSDLVDLIPLNRELDERMSDQADVIRYHADPPVVFRGVEEHSDLPVGPGTVWDLPRDADVSLLEWRGHAPAVQDHIERVMRAIYDITETPRTAFGDSGRLLSGVALETELQPLIQRTLRKRVSWSAALRRGSRMMLQLAELMDPRLSPGTFAPYRTEIVWPPMGPRDDIAEARRNLALVEGGLRSHRRAMEALGELDSELELLRVQEDRAALGMRHEA